MKRDRRWPSLTTLIFLGIGLVASVAASFVTLAVDPGYLASNQFLYGTVFLAFARLFPDFTINLFFILPIKIKWLALLAWFGYGVQLASGDVQTCALDAGQAAHCWGPRLSESGAVVDRQTPEPINSAQAFAKVSTGSIHACALGTDGFVYCWGNNPWGQVGQPPADP